MALDKLAEFIRRICTQGFTGSIEIHFFKGGIGKIVQHGNIEL